ncbi:hypothetical protein AB0E01_23115 [Nocardia vinacea]|uniref:hypothetical protein n=1 Tax=Nocardia vinacea TaxID=96468 RepID=UPI0033D51CCC
MDLLDFFREVHPWPKLYRFLKRLPPGAHYKADLEMDEELAKRIVDIEEATRNRFEDDDDDRSPDDIPDISSSANHTLEVHLLMAVCDYLQQLNSTLIAVNLPAGKSPPKVKPIERPVSAVDREKFLREKLAVEETLAELGL